MKKIYVLFISIGIIILSGCGGGGGSLVYELNADDTYTVVEISGSPTSITVPSQHNGKPVTAIADEGLRHRSSGSGMGLFGGSPAALKTIILPESIESIGENAFYAQWKLESITVDANNNHFCSIDGVLFTKDVTTLIRYPANKSGATYVIPNTVTTIVNAGFQKAEKLEDITIPNGVTFIGLNAFSTCINLKNVVIPNSVVTLGPSAFYDCEKLETIVIGNSVTAIQSATFSGCASLFSITLGDAVEVIETNAFYKCNELKSITFPKNVNSIHNQAFFVAENVEEINVDSDNQTYSSIDGVLYSKDQTILYRFPVAKQIPSFVVPSTVEVIEQWAFEYCYDLEEVILNDGLKTIKWGAFALCQSFTSIVIPDSVQTIEANAFINCPNLLSIHIGSGVETIGDGAFTYCLGLTSIVIPDNVQTLGQYAFVRCANLESVVIGPNISHLHEGVFDECPNLISITIKALEPPYAYPTIFNNLPNNFKVYVPSAVVNDYKTASSPWQDIASHIYPIS